MQEDFPAEPCYIRYHWSGNNTIEPIDNAFDTTNVPFGLEHLAVGAFSPTLAEWGTGIH